MKKTVFIIVVLLIFIEAKSQNVDLNNSSDYIRVQKNDGTGFTRAFGLNGANQLYIGSIEKTIGNMYFFNKGTGHLMTLNPSGNLGIGTTNPGAKLDILSNTGQTESLMRFKVSDAPSDYLQIANSTGSANQFIPLIKGYHDSDNRYSISIMGSTSDAMDNGTNALINFNARRLNSAVQNRPLFVWTNYDQKLMTMAANGNVGIGTTNPIEKLHVEGSFLLDAYQTGDQNGLFFREGFSSSNKYNLSILTHDDGDNSPDALDINAYDGIYFNTGSNSRNPRMTIKGDGNIGIGTTNPQEKLQIGNTYTFHDGGHKVIGFLYKPSGGVDLDPLQYSSEIRFDPVNGNFFLGTSNTVTAGPTARLSINKTGNVGIGTTNPLAKLDVRGVIKTSYSDGRYVNLFTSGDGNSYINITGGSATSRFGFQVDGSSKMSIMKNGNVGIGTADTKGFKLGVAGKIAAEEIKVALYNAWPDYVFEDNHNLPTLQQVENHIAEKGHLENIPSAAEVAKNGIQLGEMNAKLLQKIEELTLYMIEQNKKTENLIKEVEALKHKNAELEKKIK
ncbi:hypothetical protein [uncultured Aquimarina sp.]|uniref:hypothetical protein n=1 Tax=uncultured Aquimarina sp. TaxID=575652 RepID=UPI00262BFDE7|nr:hypothetical protein [uncultured Aquimarina sp.]